MGAETKRYVETVVENNVEIKTEIQNLNETILNSTSNIISETMQNMAQGVEVNQRFEIKNTDTGGGDFTVSGVDMNAEVKMALSSLIDTDQQADLLSKVQSGLSSELQESLTAKQDSGSSQGEQMAGVVGKVIETAMQSLTGADLDETQKTTIRNSLSSHTRMINENKIQSSVESNITNATLNEIAQSLNIDQDFLIKNTDTGGGDFTVANVSLSAVVTTMVESMNKSGVGTGLMADLTGLSEASLTKAVTADQKASEEKVGTFAGIGDMFGNIFKGVNLGMAGGGVGMISSVSSSSVAVGLIAMVAMNSGGNPGASRGILANITEFVKKNPKILILIIAILLVLRVRETFAKTENVVLKHDSKYLYQNGDQLCLTTDREMASQFNMQIIRLEDKPDTVLLKTADNKFLRKNGSKLVLQNYELFEKEMHDFNINKLTEISFELSRGDENIIVSKNCLKLSKKTKKPFKIILE